MRGGRVVDLACGHALVGWLMLLLDDTSERALAVDRRIPESAAKIEAVITRAWPRLAGRLELREGAIEGVALEASDVVVSAHACGSLTDEVIDAAIRARARGAVLPCCHDERTCDLGGLAGWMDSALAIDATRPPKLRGAGYRIHAQAIPETTTPKNRLLLGEP